MIGKLSGLVDSCFDDHAILDVQGVGYLVYCSAKSLHKLIKNTTCQLFIETHVREDHIHLFGFISLEEKEFFNILKQVNGIGPRLAMAILSTLSPMEISNAIAAQNKETFRRVSGVGAKMAERILIELKDKIAARPINFHGMDTPISNLNIIANDAVSALANLGINRLEAQSMVATIISKHPEASVNELIKLALKERARR